MAIDLRNISHNQSVVRKQEKKQKSSLSELMNKEIELFGKLNDKKKERFYKELGLLFNAGVDVKSALELVVEGHSSKKDIQLFTDIKDFVVSGGSLSEALDKIAGFSPYETFSIKIGEETGLLPKVLNELAAYYSRRIKNKRQVVSAVSYPAFIMFIAIGAMIFMLNFVVPLFKDLFGQFGQELPAITKLIIHVSEIIGNWFWAIFLCFLGTVVLIISVRKNAGFRKVTSALVLKIPVAGELFRKIYLARFIQAMGMLVGANTPLVQALDLAKKMVDFYPIEISIDTIKNNIMAGQSLAESMLQFKIYPKQMVTLIKVAEGINKLDKMFVDLSNQLNEEIEYQSKILSGLLEPLLIVVVGALIAVVLIAMYLPMFNMGDILS